MPIETDGLVRPETKPRDASPKAGADAASADRSRFLFATQPLATQAAMLATNPATLWRAVGGQVPGRPSKKASPPAWGASIANSELAPNQGAAALEALDVEQGTRPYGDGVTAWKRDPEEAKTDGPRDASEAAARSASTAEALEQRRGAHRQADAVVDVDAGRVGVKGAVAHAGGDTTTEGRVTLTEGTRVGYRAEQTFVDGDVALMNRGDDPRHAFSVEDAPRQTRAWSAGADGEVDLASGEASVGGAASKVTRVEQGDHVIEHTAAASGRMSVGPGGVKGGELTLVSGERDGAASSARATSATVKGEDVGVTTKRTRKAADRSSTEASGGVTVDVLGDDKGLTARGAAAKKNAAGETVIGASGRGTLETFGGDRKGAAAQGEGSLMAGKLTVTVGGGMSFVVNAPVRRGERWVVAAEQGDQVGGGVGANAGSYGAAVSVSERARTSRDFPFPTRAEALAFFGDTARVKAALDRGLADAGAMKDGERMSHETSTGAGVAGTAKGLVDVSAAIQAARTHKWTIEREGDFATVTVQERLQRGGALGGGAAGLITVGAGRSREGYRTVRVTFDLRQHEQDFLDYIAEPRTELPADGTYASLTTVDGTSDHENVDVNLGPLAASASNFGSHEEARTVGADGEPHTTTTDVGGRTTSATSRIPFLDQNFAEKDEVEMSSADGKRLSGVARSEIASDSAESVHRALANRSGVRSSDPAPRGDAEQQWTMEMRYNPLSLVAVVRAIAGLEPRSTSYLVLRQDEVQALQDALREAGSDTARQGAALAAFERATGADGMRWLNSIVAGEPSLVTVGNDVFPGAHAYADYERRLEALEMAANEPGPSVGDREREARDIVVDLSTRRGRQLQQLKPRELPDGIRARELDRSEALLERADTVVARLQAARESQEGRPAQDAPTPKGRTQLSSERSPTRCMERLTPGERSIAMGYLSKARGQFESAKRELDEAYVSAHLEYLSFERLRERYPERLAGYDDWIPRFEEELRYADSGLAHIFQLHEEAKAAEAGYDGRSVDPWVTASVSLAKAAALMKTRTERYRATLAMMRTLDVAIGRVGRPAPDPTGAIRAPFGTSAKEAQR